MIGQKEIDEINELHQEIMRDWKQHKRIVVVLSVLEFVLAALIVCRGVQMAWWGYPVGAFLMFLIAGGDVWFGVGNLKRIRKEDAEMLEHEVQHRLLMEKWRIYCERKEENDIA